MPRANLYLPEDIYEFFQQYKDEGGNPSALFANALREEKIKHDKRAKEMDRILIRLGHSCWREGEEYERFESKTILAKRIAHGSLKLDPQFNDFICEIRQDLYLTYKGNFLLYEEIEKIEELVCEYRLLEKDKPKTMFRMAPEIMKALEAEEGGSTFLDV
jgi:hypothetical protein